MKIKTNLKRMDLLKYEYQEHDPTSQLGEISLLVKLIRFYRNVSIDKFKEAIPSLKDIEKRIQKVDEEICLPKREYISEIMEELDNEQKLRSKIGEDIIRYSKAIISALYDSNFDIAKYSFNIRINEGIYWVEFYGYSDKKESDSELIVIKEVFRAVCYKEGIIFVDSTLTS